MQWADFASEHKGTSYKLHVYVGWSVCKSDIGGKDASLSGNSERAYQYHTCHEQAHHQVLLRLCFSQS